VRDPAEPRPRLYTIPPSAPFLFTLASAMLRGDLPVPGGAAPDPLTLPRAIVYLPTRRAVRALRDAFLDASGGQAALLPSIRALGDPDHDAAIILGAEGDQDQRLAGAGGARAIGQERADAVQAALVEMGIPSVSVQTESRGAGELLVRTKKGEPRNRRVEVRFEASRLLRGVLSQGLTLTPPPPPSTQPSPGAGGEGVPGVGNLCLTNPTLCYGKGHGFPGGPPTVPEGAFQPIPDNTPFHLMDVQGAEGADRETWARLFWKYRRGMSEKLAAKAANSELTSTAAKAQSRDNPNAADRLDKEIQRAYPDATKVGPGNITLWRF